MGLITHCPASFHSKLYSHHLPIHPILDRKFQTLHLAQQPNRSQRQSHRANQKCHNQQNCTILRGIGNKHSHANVGYSLILTDKLLHSLFSVRNNRCITASLLLQLSGCRFPRLIVRLPCGSPSISRTFFPVCASPIPKLAQVVVLPTPPFWLTMAMICVFIDFTSFLIVAVASGNRKSRHSKIKVK